MHIGFRGHKIRTSHKKNDLLLDFQGENNNSQENDNYFGYIIIIC